MGADDTDTGSFTAPTRRPPAASASAGGPSRQPQDGDAAGQTRTGLESTNGASLSTLDATGSPSASKQRRSSPSMAVDDQDGNESQASTCECRRSVFGGRCIQELTDRCTPLALHTVRCLVNYAFVTAFHRPQRRR